MLIKMTIRNNERSARGVVKDTAAAIGESICQSKSGNGERRIGAHNAAGIAAGDRHDTGTRPGDGQCLSDGRQFGAQDDSTGQSRLEHDLVSPRVGVGQVDRVAQAARPRVGHGVDREGRSERRRRRGGEDDGPKTGNRRKPNSVPMTRPDYSNH